MKKVFISLMIFLALAIAIVKVSVAQASCSDVNSNPYTYQSDGYGHLQQCFSGENYYHTASTQAYYSYTVHANARSFEIANNIICPGSDRYSGDRYGVGYVSALTTGISPVCAGGSSHYYCGRGTHHITTSDFTTSSSP
jgi:hypothetical protein